LDITNNATFTVVQNILQDCNSGQDIPLDYKIVATVNIIGIPINIPISNTINVACPLDVSCLLVKFLLFIFNINYFIIVVIKYLINDTTN
jgi:hypothetical protein